MTNKERFIELLRSTKREGIEKLIDFLEDNDDVQNVWHNAELPEEDDED